MKRVSLLAILMFLTMSAVAQVNRAKAEFYFSQSNDKIDPALGSNAHQMFVLDSLATDFNKVPVQNRYVIIDSYTSPDGSASVNEQIARRRAEVVERLFDSKLSTDAHVIFRPHYYEWEEIISMINQDEELPNRDEVLQAIKNVEESNGSLDNAEASTLLGSKLKKINKGNTYNDIYKNYFLKQHKVVLEVRYLGGTYKSVAPTIAPQPIVEKTDEVKVEKPVIIEQPVEVEKPKVVIPEVEAPEVVTPEVETPEVVTPEVVMPEEVKPEIPDTALVIEPTVPPVQLPSLLDSIKVPEITIPEIIPVPEVKTPEIETPEVVTPEVVTPEEVKPEVPDTALVIEPTVPPVQLPSLLDSIKVPEITIPEIIPVPEVKTPEIVTPEIEAPKVETPEVVTPEIETPEVVTPTVPVVPEIVPEVVPEVTPEIVPEVTPEVVPEVTPEVVPEVTPEVVPEAEPQKADTIRPLQPETPITTEYPQISDSLQRAPKEGFTWKKFVQNLALKTNLLYDVVLVPNVAVEYAINDHISVNADWMYAWWSRDSKHDYWRTYGGDIEARYWFSNSSDRILTGHHVGAYAGILTYDVEFGGTGYMGDKWSYMFGLSYGYSLPIYKKLNLDFEIGIGYFGGKYYVYEPEYGSYIWQQTKNRKWFGPTRAEVSLVWLLGQ